MTEKSIWKYIVPAKDDNGIEMQKGAEILTVGAQGDQICIWALVDPIQRTEVRKFRTFGTGHTVPGDVEMKFIGTSMLMGGRLVFHTFEVI